MSLPTKNCIWLTMQEVQALWDIGLRSVQYAVWKDKVLARQSVVGATWLIEYESCVVRWGSVKRQDLLEEIQNDVNYKG